MCPPLPASSFCNSACVVRRRPSTLVSIISRTRSSSSSSMGCSPDASPALLTKTSSSVISCAKAATEPGSVTSRGRARPPHASATFSSLSILRAPITTSKPSLASRIAVAAPIPLDAPVMTAVPLIVFVMPPLKTMNPVLRNKEVGIIGAPLDLGQERRGVDMGPSAIRYSGLSERLESMGIKVRDHGDARAEIPELASERDERARYLPAILGSCAQIAKDVSNMAQSGAMPLVLGGDHSIAMGSLAGLHSVHGPGGLLWIDAHGDLNTPDTSPSGL